MVGADWLIPAPVLAEVVKFAKLRPLSPPAGAEPHYRPSARPAAFVRALQSDCRAAGCGHPATQSDLDRTIPFGDGEATHPSNVKCLCRPLHLLKTFYAGPNGWRDHQEPVGTVIWTLLRAGIRHHPGSAVLSPSLCTPPVTCPPSIRQALTAAATGR